MDWNIKSEPIDISNVGDFVPTEVLYEFDGPRIFTTRCNFGDLLCFLADDDSAHRRFIAAPTSTEIVAKLKGGVRTVRDALNQPWVWFVDIDREGKPCNAWRGKLDEVPSDALPETGVMLWSHLEPIFALRAIGNDLKEGHVPMSVIRQVIDGSTTALKKIANSVFDEAKKQGRKANTIRQFYDLPAMGFSYQSFEIAFKLPESKQESFSGDADNETSSAFSEMGEKLETAINWAINARPEDDNPPPIPIELLEALEKLVPPKSGMVKSIEVRGRIFRNPMARFKLTRRESTSVRKALSIARAAQEKISTVVGLVREFDKDDLSFTLRETNDRKDHVCRFQPEFYDDLFEVFNTDARITISGRENLKNGDIEVSLVSREHGTAIETDSN